MIDLCECEECIAPCDRNARADRGGVLECGECRRGRHRGEDGKRRKVADGGDDTEILDTGRRRVF